MTPTKETLEVASTIKDTAAAKANAGVGHLRSDAVSLDVPIKVHGTRVIEAARGAVPQTEAFEESTSTMIVFPQGAVVKMATAVVGGQMVVLTNLKSGHDAICRIVKVRPYAEKHSYVEIEFTHRQPGYWGVYFSAESSGDASPMAAPAGGNLHAAPAVSVEMKIEKGHEEESEEKVWEIAGNNLPKLDTASGLGGMRATPLPAPSATPSHASGATSTSAVRPSKPESPFVGIGSQEDVQAAASATNAVGGDAFTRSARTNHAGETHRHTGLAAEISESLAVATESGHALSQPAHVAPFGRFAAASDLKNAPTENVIDGLTRYLQARKHQPNFWAMGLGVAALVLTAAGGAFFFHIGPFSTTDIAPTAAAASISSPAVARVSAPVSPVAARVGPHPTPVAAAEVPARPADPAPMKVSKAPVQEAAQSTAPIKEAAQPATPVHAKPALKVPDMFVALNAHPVSPQRLSDSGGPGSAPAIDATSASGALKGLASSIPAPSPIGEVSTPGHINAQLRPAQLVSSVLPVYPQIAQVAGVEGDVVVQASIDKSGNVSAAKVISGPVMLRTAAVEALRRWKYQPAMLDGTAVASQMTIRMRFHR